MSAKPGRPRGFDRDAALERAMALFWERGYDAVGTRDLAKAMGIGAPSLYHAFTSKRALFDEAVELYAQRYGNYIEEAMDREPDARRAITQLLSRAARQQSLPGQPAGCLIINATTNHVPASDDVAAGLRERRDHVRRLVEQKIQTDIDNGVLPTDTAAGDLAAYVVVVWQGLSLLARDGANRRELEAAAAAATAALPPPRTS